MDLRNSQRGSAFLRMPLCIFTDMLCDHLDPLQLILLGQTCKALNTRTQRYTSHAFRISRLLSPYFTPAQILDFQYLQAETGTLISGSTALQFFDRSTYPESDLDLYTEHRYALPLLTWLARIGYRFVPRPGQAETYLSAYKARIADGGLGERWRHATLFESEPRGYFGRGVAGVFNFEKQAGDGGSTRKVQLITALHSPMEIVLHFHSTCVMNVIGHQTAYALYPYATFIQRRSLICSTSGSKQDQAREKYAARGWTLEKAISPSKQLDASSDFRLDGAHSCRHIGDGQCWTIPLSFSSRPLPFSPALRPERLSSHSWSLKYDAKGEARMAFSLLVSPYLDYRYAIDASVGGLKERVKTVFGVVNCEALRVQRGERNFDEELQCLLRAYYAYMRS
ncbi:hypothetical protein AX16_001203 [Volvariella volvacea WC 439]|nr:hypothetical protein AX16_001203 [Volvariella volvacea WC 439]